MGDHISRVKTDTITKTCDQPSWSTVQAVPGHNGDTVVFFDTYGVVGSVPRPANVMGVTKK